MNTSDLVVGQMYVTKGGTKYNTNPEAIVVVDKSLTWHKKVELKDQYANDPYYSSSKNRKKRYMFKEPEIYQVTNKTSLKKYARGGVAVLYMDARAAYKQASTAIWKPDVRAAQAIVRPFSEYVAEQDEIERIEAEIKARNKIIQERARQTEERIKQIKQERIDNLTGMIEEMVEDQILEDLPLPSTISYDHFYEIPRVAITQGFMLVPEQWAESLLELAAKANLWKRLAGIDE